VRLGITNADNDWTDTYDNINYKADYRLRTVSGLFDWRPMSGVFHLTAGAVYTSKNEPSLLASGSGLDIGGTIYPGTVTITGQVQFDRDWGPYIGMGWGNLGRKEKGLLWSLDVGVAFVGDISVHLTESTGTVSPGDLRSEEQHLKDELRLMRYLPSLTAAVGWRF